MDRKALPQKKSSYFDTYQEEISGRKKPTSIWIKKTTYPRLGEEVLVLALTSLWAGVLSRFPFPG